MKKFKGNRKLLVTIHNTWPNHSALLAQQWEFHISTACRHCDVHCYG